MDPITRTVHVFHQSLEVTFTVEGTAPDYYVDLISVKRPDGTELHNLSAIECYDIRNALLRKLQKEKEEYDGTNDTNID